MSHLESFEPNTVFRVIYVTLLIDTHELFKLTLFPTILCYGNQKKQN